MVSRNLPVKPCRNNKSRVIHYRPTQTRNVYDKLGGFKLFWDSLRSLLAYVKSKEGHKLLQATMFCSDRALSMARVVRKGSFRGTCRCRNAARRDSNSHLLVAGRECSTPFRQANLLTDLIFLSPQLYSLLYPVDQEHSQHSSPWSR